MNDIRENVRRALHLPELARNPRGIRLSGKGAVYGNEGPAALIIRPDGCFALEMRGPLPLAAGYNGIDAWQIGLDGHPRLLEFGERETQVLDGLAYSGAWLDSRSLRLSLASVDPNKAIIEFENTDHFERGTIEIDVHTWLPNIWTVQSVLESQTTRFDDYRPSAGLVYPGSISYTGAAGVNVTLRFDHCAPAPAWFRSPFDPPPDELENAAFHGESRLVLERAPSGHLMVQAQINELPPGWFLFDTGSAATLLNNARPTLPRLERVGAFQMVGIGGPATVELFRLKSIQLGPLTLQRMVCAAADLEALARQVQRSFDGSLGNDVLSRCVVELDLSAAIVALHNPDTFVLPQGAWSSLQFKESRPVSSAKFEDHEGLALLDTGGDRDLFVNAPAVKRWGLLDGRATHVERMAGVGGAVSMQVGDLASFDFFGRHFAPQAAALASATSGDLADPYIAGVIGSPILEKYRIFLDYPHRRIAAIPR